MKRKRIMTLLLSASMLASMAPAAVPAFADTDADVTATSADDEALVGATVELPSGTTELSNEFYRIAPSGTLKLSGDSTISGNVNIDQYWLKDVTIDCNGHKLTITGSVNVGTGGSLYITNGSLSGANNIHGDYKYDGKPLPTNTPRPTAAVKPNEDGKTPKVCTSRDSGALSYEMLGATDFDDNAALPWHICESGTAHLMFDISGGTYNIEIVKAGGEDQGGEDRWDCQFRHRGLSLKKGTKYHLTFDVNASNAGKLYTKIGNLDAKTVGDANAGEFWHNGGASGSSDYNMKWDPLTVKKGDNHFSFDFTAGETAEALEWTFHFGGGGTVTGTKGQLSFPEGTILKFDNMSLSTDDVDQAYMVSPEYVIPGIAVNQVGYYPNLNKKATVTCSSSSELSSLPKKFQLKNKSGKTVFEGNVVKKSGLDENSGDYVAVLDFSSYDVEGTDYKLVCGDKESYAFNISKNVYGAESTGKEHSLFTNAMNYFYQNRSGIDIKDQYITSNDNITGTKENLAHKGGHNPDKAYIQKEWQNEYKISGDDVDTSLGTITATGGWYDAGDHGKYVVNGGISVWTLQNILERANIKGDKTDWTSGDMEIVIPEEGKGVPEILAETKCEMDFFFNMIAQKGEYKGLVYHKLHDYRWTGLGVRPNEDTYTRIVKPPTLAATLNVAATAAQAYRLWKDYDATYAKKCLDVAKSTYAAAMKFKNVEYDESEDQTENIIGGSDAHILYAPLNHSKGGGAYGDTEVKDDFYWAACELYVATGDEEYKSDLLSYKDALECLSSVTGGENHGSFTSFNWGNTAALGTLTLSLHPELLTSAENKKLQKSIEDNADDYIAQEEKEGYGVPYVGTEFRDDVNASWRKEPFNGYEWGSNSMVVNNAIVMAYAYDLSKDVKYLNGAAEAMDYIFGRNGGYYSYVTGYGEHATQHPHHRYWSGEIDATFPNAPCGVMSGGPNKGMVDPYVRGTGLSDDTPSQKCYVDSVEAWCVNECTINWNSPLAWMTYFLETADTTGATVNPTKTPTKTPTKEPTVKPTQAVTDAKAKVLGTTLELKGQIGGSVLFSVPADATDGYVVFEMNGEEERIDLADLDGEDNGDTVIYQVSKFVKAKETTDTINFKVFNADDEELALYYGKTKQADGYEFSVKDIAATYTSGSVYDKTTKELAKAIQNYGAYAQKLMKYKTSSATTTDSLSDITADDVEEYVQSVSGSISGAKYLGTALSLQADTDLNVFFNVSDDSAFTAKVNNKKVALEDGAVTISGIKAADLDQTYTIKLTKGSSTITVKASALSWVYSTLTNKYSDKNTVNMAKMVYRYNQAAKAYFDAH
uniref:Endoglucanase n=2 Tax=Eubacterium cellulosolvens TaxID=29322 RepID=I5AUZ0_EUBC6|nr:Cel9C [[Eubacterium] cellulosolvens]